MADLTIRSAVPDDAATILRFIRELAAYEKAGHEVTATEDDLRHSLFSADATAKTLICLVGNQPVGFAIYFFNYSTWQGRKGLYLEDLYVTPDCRGRGAGKALLAQLAAIALETGCGRFEWSVLDWNKPAMEFYEAIGARPLSDWVRYRLDGPALERLARADAGLPAAG